MTQKYYHVAANPSDMILFRKCTPQTKKKDLPSEEQDLGVIEDIFRFDDVINLASLKMLYLILVNQLIYFLKQLFLFISFLIF